MPFPIPKTFGLPDLSELDDHLVANLSLSMSIGRGFPPGEAQHLVTAFARAVETTLRAYERARVELVDAGSADALHAYLRGSSDLELAIVALNRAMRLGRALVRSKQTLVANDDLPPRVEQGSLAEMRNAIDHNDEPILSGEAGIGLALALEVGAADLSINRGGTAVVIAQEQLGGWVRALHSLVVRLTNEPDQFSRTRAT